jgi:hypothetical protein
MNNLVSLHVTVKVPRVAHILPLVSTSVVSVEAMALPLFLKSLLVDTVIVVDQDWMVNLVPCADKVQLKNRKFLCIVFIIVVFMAWHQ